MKSINILILKLVSIVVLWTCLIGFVAEHIINKEVNSTIQTISIVGSLSSTIWALNYMVKSIVKFINKKEKND